MWTDRLLFGALAIVALSRLLHPAATARTAGVVIILLLIAIVGYRYARKHRVGRLIGSIAFLAGWFTSPLLALIALIAAERLTKKRETAPVEARRQEIASAPSAPPVSAQGNGEQAPPPDDLAAFGRQLLTLKIASQAGDAVKALGAPFTSPYGDGLIPVLLQEQGRDVAIYVEPGPWDKSKAEQFYKWVALLRSSDRDELDIRVESEVPVPSAVNFYSGRSPAIEFELMGMLQLRWIPYEQFAADNAQTLARLAQEYLHRHLSPDRDGLRALDALIVDDLRAAGHPVLPSTLLLAGSFVGETLIAMYGGKWLIRGDTASDVWVAVRSPRGEAEANVFGKISKLARNGIEDSTAFFAQAIGQLPPGDAV